MSIVGVETINNGKDVILAVWTTLAQKQVPKGTPAFAKGVNVRKFVIKEVLNKSSAAG